MKKVMFAVLTAVVFSSAIGIASAYDHNGIAKAKAKSEACACKDCSCTDCKCTDCSNNCTCEDSCCDGGGCGQACCSK